MGVYIVVCVDVRKLNFQALPRKFRLKHDMFCLQPAAHFSQSPLKLPLLLWLLLLRATMSTRTCMRGSLVAESSPMKRNLRSSVMLNTKADRRGSGLPPIKNPPRGAMDGRASRRISRVGED